MKIPKKYPWIKLWRFGRVGIRTVQILDSYGSLKIKSQLSLRFRIGWFILIYKGNKYLFSFLFQG